jgi:DNA mismatch repair ATPase MutS
MKAFLMARDRDFDLKQELPWNEQALSQDLALDVLFRTMARGDEFLLQVARKAVLSSLTDLETIRYRQDVLKDCLKNSALVRSFYDLAVETIENERKNFWGILSDYPDVILRRSTEVMQMFVDMLKKLRKMADEHAGEFESEGFRAFFAMLSRELGDEYFATIENHLQELQFRGGVWVSAELGQGNKGTHYVLRKPNDSDQNWLQQLLGPRPPIYTLRIADRDQNGFKALSELENRGLNLAANALAQSNDHILSFFKMLRTELAFYIGGLNLYEQLAQMGEPITFPNPAPARERRHSFTGLYDACLALSMGQRVVGNDENADGRDLAIITGANQGGKSTFLRSVGLAQLMMQCGMFVPARSFSANVCEGLFTHFKREEDTAMESGKLDEELSRMNEIADHLTANSLLLFNESFAATNEREGSEIARQITSALLENDVKVFFVTHLYDFAHSFYVKKMASSILLRAERRPDGTRTFKLIEGEPLETSYGQDLYHRIFGIEEAQGAGEFATVTIETEPHRSPHVT